MTYSIQVRAETRAECKARLIHALQVQTAQQPSHVHDRPHLERFLCALVDMHAENPLWDIVVDAYGYTSADPSNRPLLVAGNFKVYSVHKNGAIPLQPPPAGTY